MRNKLNKNLVIVSSIILAVVAIGATTTLVACNNDKTKEIKNITFTSESITNLKDSLISLVDDKQLTKEEFSVNLLENIKDNFIIDGYNIGNLITEAILDNQNIIQLILNSKNFEYSLDSNFDNKLASLKQNLLSIPLDATRVFYTSINVSNLNTLQSTIENYISNSNNMFTFNEFEKQLNLDSFKSEIANALSIQVSDIGNITFSNKTLTIAPNSDTSSKVKFSATSNQNMIQFGLIKVNISNSSFYQEISFNDGVLEKLRNDIANEITNKGITENNINRKFSYLSNLINNIRTNDNKKLSEYITP